MIEGDFEGSIFIDSDEMQVDSESRITFMYTAAKGMHIATGQLLPFFVTYTVSMAEYAASAMRILEAPEDEQSQMHEKELKGLIKIATKSVQPCTEVVYDKLADAEENPGIGQCLGLLRGMHFIAGDSDGILFHASNVGSRSDYHLHIDSESEPEDFLLLGLGMALSEGRIAKVLELIKSEMDEMELLGETCVAKATRDEN